MSIKAIELFHGVVLTRLIRGDRPISLKMFEFNADASSSAYIVNDEVSLYIKHSKSPRERQRKGYNCAWLFTFSPEHLAELRSLGADKAVYTAFVCADRDLENDCMQVCFLTPEELAQCIDVYAQEQQSLTVANIPRGKLRVWGSQKSSNEPLLISKNVLDKWEVPGN